jgi:hypothetical protein
MADGQVRSAMLRDQKDTSTLAGLTNKSSQAHQGHGDQKKRKKNKKKKGRDHQDRAREEKVFKALWRWGPPNNTWRMEAKKPWPQQMQLAPKTDPLTK